MPTINDLFPNDSDVSKALLRKGLAGPLVNVQGLGARGDGTTDDQAAFVAASLESDGATLFIPPGRYRIGSDLTFGSAVNLFFLPGAILVPDPHISITIQGVVEAGVFSIFDLDAAGASVKGPMKTLFILPQWFGAVTEERSAASKNVRAFNAAWSVLSPLNGAMLIPSGLYFVDDTIRFSDTVDGVARNIYGTRLWGSGTIVALDTADFTNKAVLHFEGAEVALDGLCIEAARALHSKSPAVGLAVTRDGNRKGGGIVGSVDISGAYTHASLYNVSCENCHLHNSTVRNHSVGAVVWDSSENMKGLFLGIEKESNTRKSFIGCNFLSYGQSEKPVSMIIMGHLSEYSFTNCYFAMDNGYVFSDGNGVGEIHNLLIRECRCEVNLQRSDDIKDNNRFIHLNGSLFNSEISYVYFASPSDVFIEIDGGSINSLHLHGNDVGVGTKKSIFEIKVNNGGHISNITGYTKYPIQINNGNGRSILDHADFSSMADPPITGNGIYTIEYSNRYISRSGMYEKGPPRSQGELEALIPDPNSDGKAFQVKKSTAFYTTGKTRIAWLTDTFATHLISIFCAEGSLTIEHDASPVPPGFKSIHLANAQTFSRGPGALITLQYGYGGWREVSHTGDLRGGIDWQPGGENGLRPGAGETSPILSLPGVTFGDFIRVSAPYDLQGSTVTGYVASPGTIKIRIQNFTEIPITFSVGRWIAAAER